MSNINTKHMLPLFLNWNHFECQNKFYNPESIFELITVISGHKLLLTELLLFSTFNNIVWLTLPFQAFFRWRSNAARNSRRSDRPSGWGKAADRWSTWRSRDSDRNRFWGVRSGTRGRGRHRRYRPRRVRPRWPTPPSSSDEGSALKNINGNSKCLLWKTSNDNMKFLLTSNLE